jgi:SAM-dependent methyltransferase
MTSILKSIYRCLLPASIRTSLPVTKLKVHFLGHDWVYDSDYYATAVEGQVIVSARRIARSIWDDFAPSRVIDVGCGTGALLEALRDRGCEVCGLEYSEAALKYCRSRKLSVQKFDLETDIFNDDRAFDLAVSMEVAEHLPQTCADRYIDLLARLSPVIVFTAAPPGQGGTAHLNEQPASYWISKFQERGFGLAEELSRRWRENWDAAGDVKHWYWQNLMIFQKLSR